MASERFEVPAGDVLLAAERWHSDGPPVVLLHAGVADRRSWHDVAAVLAPDHDVVAYDRRAFGETPPSSGPFRHLDDLMAVLDAAGHDRAWLVGSSAGGGVALDAAVDHPDRVAGLVLLAPAVGGAPEPARYDDATQRLSDLIDAADSDRDEENRLETWLWLDGPASPEGRVGGPARQLALDMNAIALRHGVPEQAGESGLDVWSRLDQLTMPATVVWGDLDVAYLIERCEQLAARLPNARRQLLPGTAHLPYLEQPVAVAELIAQAVAAG